MLVKLLKSLNDMMTITSDPSDIDELNHYMENAEKYWTDVDKDMKERRKQLEEALETAGEFRVKFEKEWLWLNNVDNLIAKWKPHGLPEKCEEEIEQLKV